MSEQSSCERPLLSLYPGGKVTEATLCDRTGDGEQLNGRRPLANSTTIRSN